MIATRAWCVNNARDNKLFFAHVGHFNVQNTFPTISQLLTPVPLKILEILFLCK